MLVILPYTRLMYCILYASYPALQTPDVLYTVCQLLDPKDSWCTLLRSQVFMLYKRLTYSEILSSFYSGPGITSNKNINYPEESSKSEHLFLIKYTHNLCKNAIHVSHLHIIRRDAETRSPATWSHLDS